MNQKVGSWAFIIGVVVAVLTGAVSGILPAETTTLLLVIIGAVVGLLNVSPKEATSFVIASVGLIVAGSANMRVIDRLLPGLGTALQGILGNIATLLAPAVVIVGIKTVYDLAKEA